MTIFELDILGLHIAPSYYGLMYVIGFLIGYYYFLKSEILLKDDLESYFLYVFFGVILGGRIGYIIFYNLVFYLNHPLDVLKVWNGGMSFHGGLIGVIIATYIFSRVKGIKFWHIIDNLAVITPIRLFFGRIGNYLNKELLGLPGYNGPLAIIIGDTSYFPSPLLEAFLEGIVLFLILFFASKNIKTPRVLSAMFLIFYGIFRSGVEFFVREPDIQIGYILEYLTMGSILSYFMILFGVVLLFTTRYEAK